MWRMELERLTSSAVGSFESQKAVACSTKAVTVPKAVTGAVVNRICTNKWHKHFQTNVLGKTLFLPLIWVDHYACANDSNKQRFHACKHFCFTGKHFRVLLMLQPNEGKKSKPIWTWVPTEAEVVATTDAISDSHRLTNQIWQPVDSKCQCRRSRHFPHARVYVTVIFTALIWFSASCICRNVGCQEENLVFLFCRSIAALKYGQFVVCLCYLFDFEATQVCTEESEGKWLGLVLLSTYKQ